MSITKPIQLLILTAILVGCNDPRSVELHLEKTPEQLELFGEGVISTQLYERDVAIAPDGEEITYTLGDYKQSRRCLVRVRKVNGEWTEPKILNISGEHQDIEPFYSLDGKGLYFASDRPVNDTSSRTDYNIWYSERDGDNWKEPVVLGTNINTPKDEFYPSVSQNGNLYFTATREDGVGREDIFVSRKKNGEYTEAVVLDSAINTKFYEFNAFISPAEDLLIFSSYGRSDDTGGGDLYYSQRGEDGKWQPAKNFGGQINSDKLDYCPFVDFERSNLYFTSERMKEGRGKFKEVEELIRYASEPENGMGNIYRIGIEELAFGPK